jgi:hypothetical protein
MTLFIVTHSRFEFSFFGFNSLDLQVGSVSLHDLGATKYYTLGDVGRPADWVALSFK